MAQAQRVVNINTGRRHLLKNINCKALAGSGNRKLKHICSDLLHKLPGDEKDVAADCELHVTTVKRLMECPKDYSPNGLTLEKVIKACGAIIEVKMR